MTAAEPVMRISARSRSTSLQRRLSSSPRRAPSRALATLASFGWRYAPLLTVIFHGKIRRRSGGRTSLDSASTTRVTQLCGRMGGRSARCLRGSSTARSRHLSGGRGRLALKRQAQQPTPKGRAAASVAGVSTSREWRPRHGRRLNLAALGHWRPGSLALGPPAPPPDLGQDRRQGLEF
jgi:hypothetical protein